MKVHSTAIPINVKIFLALLQRTEGTDKYTDPYIVRYGGSFVTPNLPHDGKKITAGAYTSSAVGAYQFLFNTWKAIHSGQNPAMTPERQDTAAITLIKQAGAYENIINSEWETAIKKTNKIWASLPGSPYGQPTFKIEKALTFIKNNIIPASGMAGIAVIILLFFF